MRRVALTGGIATGKSYVASRMRAAGLPVVDADVLAREAVAPGSPGLAAVVERFGPGVLASDGTLNRAVLGEQVFQDAAARRELEAIIHPDVRARIDRFFADLPPDTPAGVADIPLLFETNRAADFDAVVVAACPREMQIERVMTRDGLSRAQAEARVAAQLPIDDTVARATYVIRADGRFAETDAQVARVIDVLMTTGR